MRGSRVRLSVPRVWIAAACQRIPGLPSVSTTCCPLGSRQVLFPMSDAKTAHDADYFHYLAKRSRLGLLYRTYSLYPRLSSHLEGQVLDVGCGIGDLLRFRPNTVGVDVNPETVAFCQQQGLDARLMPIDVLPFEADSFDRVVLDNVLEHLTAPKPLLAEIARVLRPGGRAVVGVPGSRGYAEDPDHKIFYDERRLIEVFTSAGYQTRAIFHTPLRSAFLERKMRQYCVYGVFEAAAG